MVKDRTNRRTFDKNANANAGEMRKRTRLRIPHAALPNYTGNAMKTDIWSRLPAALTRPQLLLT
ncbi:MAG TPA: hypothetical protein DEB39_13395 [Planctomycetaceae bacterium]|nr:hypothetical protein [Planctomycetaceae bacterium]